MNRATSTIRNWLLAAGLAALLLLSSAPALWSQEGGQDKAVSLSKVERKNKAPVSKDILRVNLVKPVEAKLDNGITVLIMEDHRFPTVSVQFQVTGAGPIFEPEKLPGLANITAQMLREGTRTRNSRQIAEDVDKLGATLSASSGFGSTVASVSASGLSDNFEEWFALAADILLNPSFPADELAKLKQRMKVQLVQQRTSPQFLARERFQRAIFGGHPAAVVSATPKSIDEITPELLARWHQERYTPQNTILGIAGDVKASELAPKLKKWLAAWQKTDLKEVLPPHPTAAKARKIFLVDRPNSVQTTISLGKLAIERRDPDYIALDVMNRIVGGGPSARLFLNLREEKGYTYGVYSGLTAMKYPGPWLASGDFRTDVTDGAVTELLKEVDRIRDEEVPAAELEEAKGAIVARFALSLEQPDQLLSYALIRQTYNLPADYWDTYPANVMDVSAGEVQRVARKYLDPKALQIVAVGEAGKIKSVLEKYGTVEVYDTEGQPVAAKAAAAASGQ